MRKRVKHPSGGDRMVQEHFVDSADVNKIMDRHLRTGVLQGPGIPSARNPMFVELSGDTYHEMLNKVQAVQGKFAGLPAKVRKRFANNPEQLIRFCEDSNNLEEAIKLGLVNEEDLSEERINQLNLVREADKKDQEEFKEWQRNKRAKKEDEPPWEEEQEESIPPKKGGKRTS